MTHDDARKWKWRGNWRMKWVASTLYTTSEHGVSSITTAGAHTSAVNCRLNWCPRRFKWTRPFRRKTKSGFCACAITFQTQSTTVFGSYLGPSPCSIPKENRFWFMMCVVCCVYVIWIYICMYILNSDVLLVLYVSMTKYLGLGCHTSYVDTGEIGFKSRRKVLHDFSKPFAGRCVLRKLKFVQENLLPLLSSSLFDINLKVFLHFL